MNDTCAIIPGVAVNVYTQRTLFWYAPPTPLTIATLPLPLCDDAPASEHVDDRAIGVREAVADDDGGTGRDEKLATIPELVTLESVVNTNNMPALLLAPVTGDGSDKPENDASSRDDVLLPSYSRRTSRLASVEKEVNTTRTTAPVVGTNKMRQFMLLVYAVPVMDKLPES